MENGATASAEQGTAAADDQTLSVSESKDGSQASSAVSTPRRRRDSIMKQRSSMVGSRDSVKKSVCFSTAPDLHIATADDCFKHMEEGTEFIKLRKADRQYLRTFYLNEQHDEITWYPTKKPAKARLRIDDVKEIRTGRNTALFRTHEYANRYNEDCQFSIVFGHEYCSLDLVARTPELANIWFAGLNTLLAQRNSSRRLQIRLSEASLNESATGNSRLLQRTVSNTRPADEDADGDANAAATTCATPPIAISGTTNASLNGSTSAEGAQTQHNGEHLAVTSRSYSCPSASLSDRSRRPTFESHTSCTEPIGEDDGEAPIVFEIGDALVEQFVAPNGSDTAAVDGQKACSNCVGLRDRWLRQAFANADTRHTGILRETEALRAMKLAGYNVCPSRVRRKIMELDASRDENERGLLTVDQFVKMCQEIFTRPDIYFLLTRYASNAEYLTIDELIYFLETEQSVNLTRTEASALIARYEPTTEGKYHLHIGIDGLTSYLMSPDCGLFDPRHSRVCQDMTQPLTHYFISASHNTYLIEDQLHGPCSVDGYIHALQRGCRYVEVDVFDGADDEPIVSRASSKPSKLTFNAALEAINKYAFVASEYPLIVALSVHCSVQQQVKVAQLIRRHFGSRLYTESLGEGVAQLPSPEELRRRVLVKSKRCESKSASASPEHTASSTSSSAGELEFGYVSSDYDSDGELYTQSPQKEKRHQLARQLSELVTCLRSTTFRGLDASYNTAPICTLSERAAQSIATTRGDQLVNWCKSAVLCVSPDGTRTDSSNFSPHDFWSCGCQIAALNWQSPGAPVDVNVGFFRQNGACGYVLKPAVMRDPIATFQPSFSNASPDITPRVFIIKILSAQQLPKPRGSTAKGDFIEPYIVVQSSGITTDCTQQRTRTLEYDGGASLINESFEVLVHVPQLATLRFLILDDNSLGDDFIAQYAAPLDCIRTGYRHVPLYGYDGSPLNGAKLFVHVTATNLDMLTSSVHSIVRRKSVSRLSNGMSVSPSVSNAGTLASAAAAGNTAQPHVRSKSSSTAIRRALRSAQSLSTRALVEPRPTGVKPVDELFVSVAPALHNAADRREAISFAFAQLREACGLPPSASAKQCMRYLLNALQQSSNSAAHNVCVFLDAADPRRMRIASNMMVPSSSANNTCVVSSNNQQPLLPLPDVLEKVIQHINKLVEECNMLLSRADCLTETLTNCYRRALEYHEMVTNDNDTAMQSQSARKRIEQRLENYRWNVRIVKAQAESLNVSKKECLESLEQIRSAFEQQETGAGYVSVCRVSGLSFGSSGSGKSGQERSGDSSRKGSRKASIVDRLRSSVSSSVPISRTLSRDVLF